MELSTYNQTSVGRIYLFIRSILNGEAKRYIGYFFLAIVLLPFIYFLLYITIFGTFESWVAYFTIPTFYTQVLKNYSFLFVLGYYILINKTVNLKRVPHFVSIPIKVWEKLVALLLIGLINYVAIYLIPYIITLFFWLFAIGSTPYESVLPFIGNFISLGREPSVMEGFILVFTFLSTALVMFYFSIRCKNIITAFLLSILTYVLVPLSLFLIISQLPSSYVFSMELTPEWLKVSLLILTSLVTLLLLYISYLRLQRKEVR